MPGLLETSTQKKKPKPPDLVGQTSTKPKMPGLLETSTQKKTETPPDPLGRPVLSQTRGQTMTHMSGLLTLVGRACTNPTCLLGTPYSACSARPTAPARHALQGLLGTPYSTCSEIWFGALVIFFAMVKNGSSKNNGQTSTKPKMPAPDPLGRPVLSQTRGQTMTHMSGLLTLVGRACTNPTCLLGAPYSACSARPTVSARHALQCLLGTPKVPARHALQCQLGTPYSACSARPTVPARHS